MLTRVELTDNLEFARIFWYLLPAGDERAVAAGEKAFDSATNRLRKIVSRQLRMKSVPKLQFLYDRGVDNARRVDELLAGGPAEDGDE